jgi:extradiol dioxygenase family protein
MRMRNFASSIGLTKNARFMSKQAFEVLDHPAPDNPFHLAIPVHDITEGKFNDTNWLNWKMCLFIRLIVHFIARKVSLVSALMRGIQWISVLLLQFYGEVLGLKEGRRSEDKWQDYSLHGHQIVCHYVGESYRCKDYYNPVDGDEVPVPHFGLVLTEKQFKQLQQKLEASKVNFIVKPHLRFAGQPGEQWTMFFKDPSNNNLEFKAMTNPSYLFAKYNVIEGK